MPDYTSLSTARHRCSMWTTSSSARDRSRTGSCTRHSWRAAWMSGWLVVPTWQRSWTPSVPSTRRHAWPPRCKASVHSHCECLFLAARAATCVEAWGAEPWCPDVAAQSLRCLDVAAQSLRCPPSLLRQVLRVRQGKAATRPVFLFGLRPLHLCGTRLEGGHRRLSRTLRFAWVEPKRGNIVGRHVGTPTR